MTHADVAHDLGFTGSPASLLEMNGLLEQGISIEAAETLRKEMGLNEDSMVALLGMGKTTYRRFVKESQRVDSLHGDRLYRLARIYGLAREVLEGKNAAIVWLTHPQRAPDRQVPLSLLRHEAGARAVEELLNRIEHGVLV